MKFEGYHEDMKMKQNHVYNYNLIMLLIKRPDTNFFLIVFLLPIRSRLAVKDADQSDYSLCWAVVPWTDTLL